MAHSREERTGGRSDVHQLGKVVDLALANPAFQESLACDPLRAVDCSEAQLGSDARAIPIDALKAVATFTGEELSALIGARNRLDDMDRGDVLDDVNRT